MMAIYYYLYAVLVVISIFGIIVMVTKGIMGTGLGVFLILMQVPWLMMFCNDVKRRLLK